MKGKQLNAHDLCFYFLGRGMKSLLPSLFVLKRLRKQERKDWKGTGRRGKEGGMQMVSHSESFENKVRYKVRQQTETEEAV